MHGLQMVPLSELISLSHEADARHGAAPLTPGFDREALLAELEALDAADDLEVDEDVTRELAAVDPTTGVRVAPAGPDTGEQPAVEGATDADEDSPEWLTAAGAAEALDVTVRHLRRLATAGKIGRKRENDRTMYCISPWLEAQARARQEAAAGNKAATGAAPTPETCRADVSSPESDDASETESTGVIARVEVEARSASQVHDDETVIALDDVDIVRHDEIVAEELVNTNRELMRLVDGLLTRWSEVNTEQSRSAGELHDALRQTLQVQQCLQHWQHHAATLERRIVENLHLATRALDVADEALATRWTTGKRRRVLQDRLATLRDRVE